VDARARASSLGICPCVNHICVCKQALRPSNCPSVWVVQCFDMTALRQRKGSKGKEPPLSAELQSQQSNCCTESVLHGE